MRAVIRVNSSHLTGSGHVMRCLTLADMLSRDHHDVSFLCRNLPGNCYQLIEAKGYSYTLLPYSQQERQAYQNYPPCDDYAVWLGVSQERDAEDCIQALNTLACDWLITDCYGLDIVWETKLRPVVANIMVIDDLADRRHDCDILLDHNCYLNAERRYDHLIPRTALKLLGPQYALIKPEFFQIREQRRRNPGNRLETILVFLGGMDIKNHSKMVLEALLQSSLEHTQIHVVLGNANPHGHALQLDYREHKNVFFHIQPDYYAELLVKADLAVGAGGVGMLERLIINLPTVLLQTADNQRQVCEDMQSAGMACFADSPQSLLTLFDNLTPDSLEQLKKNNFLMDQKTSLLHKELRHAFNHCDVSQTAEPGSQS